MIKKIEYNDDDELIILDQTLLPVKEKYLKTKDYEDVIDAIKKLKVRGAPLIGIAAAYGVVLGMNNGDAENLNDYEKHFYFLLDAFRKSRPTARNLFYAMERIEIAFRENKELTGGTEKEIIKKLNDALLDEADRIFEEDIEMCRRIGTNGAELIGEKMNILTHCNTGELATGGIGTALGIITTAAKQSKDIFVFVDETRPLLQGARLTTYELEKNGIEFDLIVDSMAANLMKDGIVDCVIIGADRIASNGDVVNKVGSYNLAVNCLYHKVPFYVAAPGTTIDFECEKGDLIEIEERAGDEVTSINGNRITKQVPVKNPSFDMVPNGLVTAIITEYKVHYPPYNFKSLRHLFSGYIQTLANKEDSE
ncbi:MAG: S-methyl-5-thioribose-1-phosphate isomerase [Ignavibacteria bacterium]